MQRGIFMFGDALLSKDGPLLPLNRIYRRCSATLRTWHSLRLQKTGGVEFTHCRLTLILTWRL